MQGIRGRWGGLWIQVRKRILTPVTQDKYILFFCFDLLCRFFWVFFPFLPTLTSTAAVVNIIVNMKSYEAFKLLFFVVKNLPTNAGDAGSVPAWGRPRGGGNGNPLQYSCLGNPIDRAAWQATVCGVSESQTWLSRHTRYFWGLLSPPPSNIWIPNMIYNRQLVTSVPSLSSVTSPQNSIFEQRGKSLRYDSVV